MNHGGNDYGHEERCGGFMGLYIGATGVGPDLVAAEGNSVENRRWRSASNDAHASSSGGSGEKHRRFEKQGSENEGLQGAEPGKGPSWSGAKKVFGQLQKFVMFG
jgi:hypothetical protein